MLEALKKVEAPPFKLLRLKNNLASEKAPSTSMRSWSSRLPTRRSP